MRIAVANCQLCGCVWVCSMCMCVCVLSVTCCSFYLFILPLLLLLLMLPSSSRLPPPAFSLLLLIFSVFTCTYRCHWKFTFALAVRKQITLVQHATHWPAPPCNPCTPLHVSCQLRIPSSRVANILAHRSPNMNYWFDSFMLFLF